MTTSNYCASIISIVVKDKFGNWVDIVIGPNTIEKQLMPTAKYYGSTIDRYANRIAEGKVILNYKQYKLDENNRSNCLHGGDNGFDTKVWNLVNQTNDQIDLNYISAEGEEGFLGELNTTVCYSMKDNVVQLKYSAFTNADTIFNITNHSCKYCREDNILFIMISCKITRGYFKTMWQPLVIFKRDIYYACPAGPPKLKGISTDSKSCIVPFTASNFCTFSTIAFIKRLA